MQINATAFRKNDRSHEGRSFHLPLTFLVAIDGVTRYVGLDNERERETVLMS